MTKTQTRKASDLVPGDTFEFRGQTFTVAFTKPWIQTGVFCVRVFSVEFEMPFTFPLDREV